MSKKIPAGISGILLGSFGVHKFIMGFPSAGLTMLAITVVSRILGWIGVPFFKPISLIMILVGFIEGIIYLAKNDTDFYRDYVIKRQAWF